MQFSRAVFSRIIREAVINSHGPGTTGLDLSYLGVTLPDNFLFLSWERLWSVRVCSVAQSSLTLWDPVACRTPGFRVHHQLPEFTQTHVHRVGDAIQARLCLVWTLLATVWQSLVMRRLTAEARGALGLVLVRWVESGSRRLYANAVCRRLRCFSAGGVTVGLTIRDF